MGNLTVVRTLNGVEEHLPGKWIICPACRGNGHVLHSAMRGVAYTEEDRDRMGPELFEDMQKGVYDVPCETCKEFGGYGKVIVIDREKLDADTLKQVLAAERGEREFNHQWLSEILTQALMGGDRG